MRELDVQYLRDVQRLFLGPVDSDPDPPARVPRFVREHCESLPILWTYPPLVLINQAYELRGAGQGRRMTLQVPLSARIASRQSASRYSVAGGLRDA
ncbi:hypothetical protein EXIGLDRAFT_726908 [Exidia glandulosa HHB12029]|uniref:Uncharacterized protein n=1 Tax=Exidia glandulosa HHB12029 TaxID=1314781 RepID=A0A165DJK4_EXIGL|nr:hypothetical protein EXIGLDRAFT_726908 [Exidia glandulosa HHB12029]